jgi:hypothetical protein
VVEYKKTNEVDWTMVDAGLDNTFMIDNILDCEFYEVRIKSQCAVTNNESDFSETFYINSDCEGCTKEFCSFGNKNIEDEWIDIVEIENIFSNASGVNENGYGNYLGQFEINLQTQEEYTLNLTPGFSSSPFDEYFSVYIDFDQDGVFVEDENIFKNEQSTQSVISGTFSVPANALPGIARMRVVMRFNELNGPCDEIGFEFGEIEDYCVNIINNEECPTAYNSVVTDSTKTSLTFELMANELVELYLIAIREKGEEQFTIITSQLNEIVVSNLSECTPYEYSSGYKCNGETKIDSVIFDIYTLCDVNTNDVEDMSLTLFPNPSYGDLNINFDGPIAQDLKLELISAEGEKVLLKNVAIGNQKSISIDVQNVPSGIYFLMVTNRNKRSIMKWVKY